MQCAVHQFKTRFTPRFGGAGLDIESLCYTAGFADATVSGIRYRDNEKDENVHSGERRAVHIRLFQREPQYFPVPGGN
jgi:hypothetical protein